MTGHCGATLVNATLGGMQSITGASTASLVAVEGKIFGGATEMLSGTVNGVVAGALGASQPTPPYATTGSGGGTQSLQSFSELSAPLNTGNLPGGGTPSSAYYGNTLPQSK